LRDEVHIPSVTEVALFSTADDTGPSTGLVRLRQFQPNSTVELKSAVESLTQAGISALVIDLRGNTGGLFNEAVSVSSLFLDQDLTVVKTRGRVGVREENLSAVAEPGPFLDVPLAILIDGSSASASEIVAAALRDHQRAVLVGSNSFGKWTAQDLIYIPSGSNESLLKLTTQSFHPPIGSSISHDERGQRSGLIPDLAIATNPEIAYQLALAHRSRSYERIEAPAAVSRFPVPDRQSTVDSRGNGDPVLVSALQLLGDSERYKILLQTEKNPLQEEPR
ncbi:MAG: S41 family peptidase, partial [Planctomycetota bacterium]